MTAPTARQPGSGRATDRFEFRLQAEVKATIAAAAATLGLDASDFAREVLLQRAEEILAERAVKTVVPAAFFDEVLAALDEPAPGANEALGKAMAAARTTIAAAHLHPQP